MWEWREGMANGGWHRAAASGWTWEGSPQEPQEWLNIEAAALRPGMATLPMGPRAGRAPYAVPEPAALPGPPGGGGEPTPIFDAVAWDWANRRHDGNAGDGAAVDTSAGSGRIEPVQRPQDRSGSHDLAPVGVVPPPPPRGGWPDDVAGPHAGLASADRRDQSPLVPEPRSGARSGQVPGQRARNAGHSQDLAAADGMPPHPPLDGSLEDELTRRAQRRRRPHAPTSAAGGRHALQPREEDRSTFHEDRDTVGAVAAGLTFDRII